MFSLYGISSYAVCVYLCICVSVFVYLCMRHLVMLGFISLDQELSENVWFVMYSLNHHTVEITGDVTEAGRTNDKQGKKVLLSF